MQGRSVVVLVEADIVLEFCLSFPTASMSKRRRHGHDDDEDDKDHRGDSSDQHGLDLDVDGCSRDRSTASVRGSWFPEGPGTLFEVMDAAIGMTHFLLQHALMHDLKFVAKNLREVLVTGMVGSSCFSGMGTFEAAVYYSWARLREAMGLSVPECGHLVFWSACDIGPSQQSVLLAHTGSTRSSHVFCDVIEPSFWIVPVC